MGRALNILDDNDSTVDEVFFDDEDGDKFLIQHGYDDVLVLKSQDTSIRFIRADIDKLIALFQSAKHYNI